MASEIVVTLPLPPKELHPNSRPHWASKARAVKRYREYAWACAMEEISVIHGFTAWSEAACTARFHFATRRRRDKDNLLASLKAAFDGLADAGVVLDDSGISHRVEIGDPDPANPRVEITVRGIA